MKIRITGNCCKRPKRVGKDAKPQSSVFLAVYFCGIGLLGLSVGDAFAAETSTGPSGVIFIAQLVVLMAVGRLLGEAMQRTGQPSVMGVRRGKAALSSGCKSHPATAPAGSNRSSHGGDEVAEASG